MCTAARIFSLPRLAFLMTSGVLCGCGGSNDIELADVAGVVKYNGNAVANAVITFSPKSGGPAGVGKTDSEGHYELYTAGESGAVLGTHSVSIICVAEPEPIPKQVSSDDPSYQYGGVPHTNYKPKPVLAIPAQYNTQTQLSEDVESGSNEINFDLK